MIGSSENMPFVNQSASMIMLSVNPNQNMIIDLNTTHYNALLHPMIKCLKLSPLMKALIMVDELPLVCMSRAYSSAIYNIQDEVINFEVANHKTSINKPNFCKLLGLA
ncbi:unnamed protein product [Lactuca saligna]|uniref:Uncharacterized protein n=1 Tax=Lactuca saligna TaxID=75948 RepID=A0AA36EQ78_LACSI|nr:unnamed protein product [Lactuca saligna]